MYRYVVDLFELWQSHGCGSRSSEYYTRLCQLAAEYLPTPEEVRVYDVLELNEPTDKQIEFVALTLAKRAVELHWEL